MRLDSERADSSRAANLDTSDHRTTTLKPGHGPAPPSRRRFGLLVLAIGLLLSGCFWQSDDPPTSDDGPSVDRTGLRQVLDDYLEARLEMFPTWATAAGDRRGHHKLEDLSPQRLEAWVEYNRETRDELAVVLNLWSESSAEDTALRNLRLDAQAVHRKAALAVFTQDEPRRNPLYWSRLLSNVSIFLLIRDNEPQSERLAALAERVSQVPRLCDQAVVLLSETDPATVSIEKARLAAAGVEAGARFYESGWRRVADRAEHPETKKKLLEVGAPAAAAHRRLAATMHALAEQASGDPRLGERYAESFRLGTGLEEPVAEVLARAELDLDRTRAEAASFCRSIWSEYIESDGAAPADERDVVRACFRRLGQDQAPNQGDFVHQYRELSAEAHAFVTEQQILTPPGPLTLSVDTAPSFLEGQSVGGIYPPGPFAPDADALLFVPSIADDRPAEQKALFYGDFNNHFNRMITPHEVTPGHYAQGKTAARGPSKIRAIFTDGVYVEGWGTFSEILMIEHGWGDPLTRVAHLKKQLENIARTIVDIRVHSRGMDQEEMLDFLRNDAMQEGQFAINMWTRALISSPQLTTYYLGYRDISEIYRAWRRQHPQAPAREFSDRMMSLGPVPVRHYRTLFAD